MANNWWLSGAVLVLLLAFPLEAQELRLKSLTERVGQYEPATFEVQWSRAYTNAFDPDEVELNLHIAGPVGPEVSLPAFWYQAYERRRVGTRDWFYPIGLPRWAARFAPTAPGVYRVQAVVRDSQGTNTSSPVAFECVPSTNRGFLRISRTDPRFLEFTDGSPFFAIGQNLAFIGNQQYVSLSKAGQIFGKLHENGANYLRIWTCCEDWAMAIEARKSAWGRSWDWHPSIVAEPGAASTRKCLQLSAEGKPLKVDPSHSVALRPSTKYRLAGEVRLEAGATLNLTINPGDIDADIRNESNQEWTDFSQEFVTAPGDYWLTDLSFRQKGGGHAYLRNLSLREEAGGPELLWEAEVNRPARGFYNPTDCFMLDELIAAAERNGQYLQLCMLTRDLYMDALKDPASAQYDRAISDAKKFFRYAVARWGYSTGVAAWEYWNEMNPGLPTDRFYRELGAYLEQADIYRHLRTTSTWGPSAKDCRHPALDIADTHFYLRPVDKSRLQDEVEAIIDRTQWLREQAPSKPAHLGEFGLADDKWRITDEMRKSRELADVHNALWASALSGASGTALFWWWERLDQANAYNAYGPLSRFVSDIPWTKGNVAKVEFVSIDPRLRAMGLRADKGAWCWCFDKQAAWEKIVLEGKRPVALGPCEIELRAVSDGDYDVIWWDTRKAQEVSNGRITATNGSLRLKTPAFTRDLAFRIRPVGF